MPAWLTLILALALTAAWVPAVRKIMLRAGLVVQPGGRHAHTTPTPTAGGVAMFVAVWGAMLTAWPWDEPVRGMFLGSLILLGLCLVDDLYHLPVAPRLLGQVLVAIIAWQYGVHIEGITNPFGGGFLDLGQWAAPLTIVWIVFLINAVNWLDGLDGLAAGVMAIAATTLAVMGYLSGFENVWLPAATIAAACLGFLLYNFHPASIFMGDSGAMFLGFMIACLSVVGAFKSTAQIAVAAPFLVLGIPIYDTVTTISRRLLKGKPVYSADRGHLHHRLLDRGLSVPQVVLIIYALTAALCLAALGLWSR